MFSALNIYKPKGITSHDVVSKLRRIYGIKKIGHLGTLDPLAEGVLPVCLGQATRLIEYFPDDKRYTAEVTLGRTTTTLDSEGETVSVKDCTALDLSETNLQSVLQQYTGTILQQVPLYSAVHVGGKKLYELARQGKTAELPTRETTIHELKLLSCNFENPAHPVLTLDIHCSSGTYIRSLARDIGDTLGNGAYMSGLIRTSHGQFNLENSVRLDLLAESTEPAQFLQDPVQFLTLPVISLASEEEARMLTNGIKLLPALLDSELDSSKHPKLKPNAFYLAMFQERPLGVVQWVSQKLKPIKIFHWG
jgi:tRNA pseudouridine55 synthase